MLMRIAFITAIRKQIIIIIKIIGLYVVLSDSAQQQILKECIKTNHQVILKNQKKTKRNVFADSPIKRSRRAWVVLVCKITNAGISWSKMAASFRHAVAYFLFPPSRSCQQTSSTHFNKKKVMSIVLLRALDDVQWHTQQQEYSN